MSFLLKKLRNRITRLKKLNYSDADIAELHLAPDLMSSEDSDRVCHPPSYRSTVLTPFFERTVDVVKLSKTVDTIKQRGSIHKKTLLRSLFDNPNIVK